MEFVNSIAKIVHMEVSLHGGAPNKNIGDAFLLVWKLPKGFTSKDIPRLKDLPKLPVEPSIPTKRVESAKHGNDSNTADLQDPRGFKGRDSGIVNIHAFGGGRPITFEDSPSKTPSGNFFEVALSTALAYIHAAKGLIPKQLFISQVIADEHALSRLKAIMSLI